MSSFVFENSLKYFNFSNLWLFSPNLEQKLFYAQWRSSSDNWRSRPHPHFHKSVNAKLLSIFLVSYDKNSDEETEYQFITAKCIIPSPRLTKGF